MVQVGMVFAIIFTAIVIAFLFAVGFGQIQQFFCVGSNAQLFKGITNVESVVDEVFVLAKGSSKTYPLAIPADTSICFLNKTNPGPYPHADPSKTWDPDSIVLDILQDPFSSAFGANLWITSCGAPLGEGYTINYLSPSESFCIRGGDTLFIENKGSFVDISYLE